MGKLKLIQYLVFLSFILGACSDEEGAGPDLDFIENHLAQESAEPETPCEDSQTCVVGYISHGMPISLEPIDSQFDSFVFLDAQDLADRFGTTFIRPYLESTGIDSTRYKISLEPMVTRKNFVTGFEIYTDSSSGGSKRQALSNEGNFLIQGLPNNESVQIRLVKTFPIRFEHLETKEISYQCMVIHSISKPLFLNQENPFAHLGAIRNFEFYYLSRENQCSAQRELANKDSDGDFIPDLEDSDDDNDGIADQDDCSPLDPKKWQSALAYEDKDLDGFGHGEGVEICYGKQSLGFVFNKDDCDDSARDLYFLHKFAYVDQDLDGYFKPQEGLICGPKTMPSSYAISAEDIDCDDEKPDAFIWTEVYQDQDGDSIGAGDLMQICAGSQLPEFYSYQNGDCDDEDKSRFQLLEAFLDADEDGFGSTPVSICSGEDLEIAYSLLSGDCDDKDADAFQLLPGYLDQDRDTFGTGSLLAICSGNQLKSGYAGVRGDCNDEDSSRFQILAYQYVDIDGDGYTKHSPGLLCSGLHLDTQHLMQPRLTDCDDDDPLKYQAMDAYQDLDGDGRTAGEKQRLCTDGTFPRGYMTNFHDDCDDHNSNKYQMLSFSYRDADQDGVFKLQAGYVCSGANLPSHYANHAEVLDCDDADSMKFQLLNGYLDVDGDSFGAGGLRPVCSANSLPSGYATVAGDYFPMDALRHGYGQTILLDSVPISRLQSAVDKEDQLVLSTVENTSDKPSIWLEKIDIDGNSVWRKKLLQYDQDTCYGCTAAVEGITITPDNKILVALQIRGGFRKNASDTDPSMFELVYSRYSYQTYRTILIKLDEGGSFMWNSYISSTSGYNYARGLQVVTDSSNRTWVCANVYVNLGGGEMSSDFYLAAFDSEGNLTWNTVIGNDVIDGRLVKNRYHAINDACTGLALDIHNNLYVTGLISGTLDFDFGPGKDEKSAQGFFLLKVGSDYSYRWSHIISAGPSGPKVAVDGDHVLVISRFAESSVDFYPGPEKDIKNNPNPNKQIATFISRYDTTGRYVSTKVYPHSPGRLILEGGHARYLSVANPIMKLESMSLHDEQEDWHISWESSLSFSGFYRIYPLSDGRLMILFSIRGTVDFDFTEGEDVLSDYDYKVFLMTL
ncbi:MAG: hypothetical protein AB8G05_05580 [Oligoflexales bacterium]